MPFPNLRLLVLDTETTGFVPKTHRVMEYACALIEEGKVTKEYGQLLSLPDGATVPEPVQVLTRIFPEDLNGKPTFAAILMEISSMVSPDTVIVGQNVKFDLGMLRGEGWDLTACPWVDTAMLASIVFPELSSYSLGYVSKALKLNHDPPHRALGDVRATVEFLAKCCERLQELSAADLHHLQRLAAKGPEGYKRLFSALSSSAKIAPGWLTDAPDTRSGALPVTLNPPKKGSVALVEEPADRTFLPSVLAGLSGRSWCAVKNIEAAARRYDCSKSTVLYPPEFVLSKESEKALLAQETFSADEMTLAMKLHLYSPKVRSDLPIHGEEYAVFAGKLACTAKSPEYIALMNEAAKNTAVLSHQHLLTLCEDADRGIPEGTSVIIDDASMLEDTATHAYAWTCHLPSLRGAAQGHELLTKCVDLIELWAERLRADMDLRYLAPSDLETKDATELKRVLLHVLGSGLPPQPKSTLEQLLKILDKDNLPGRFAWVESMQDGSKTIKSVPEDIGELLADRLYDFTATTLLVPPASADGLATILPDRVPVGSPSPVTVAPAFTISMPVGSSLEAALRTPAGKMILLVPSKRTIEDVFVRHTERLEEDGVTLLCQGFSGGAGRMQAEFCVAKAPAIMVMTPWMYEGMDLEPEMTDKLVLQTMPFDHPAHPVVSRRAQRFADPFNDYSLPRLRHRLFRLIRTFARHAKKDAVFEILDDRLRAKAYGKQVAKYLESLFIPVQASTPTKAAASKKATAQKKEGGQLSLL